LPFLGLAFWLAITTPRPDILIEPEAKTVAVRTADGRLSILNARQGRISAETWLAADGDTRKSRDVLDRGFRCDATGCVAHLVDGTIVAVGAKPDAFADDCERAGVVISPFDVPVLCKAPAIDRKTMETTGAISLRRVGTGWKIETVRSPYADRPWYGRPKPADPEALTHFRKRIITAKSEAEEPLASAGDIPVPEAPDEPEDDDQ
jgi:competence protein ComEC